MGDQFGEPDHSVQRRAEFVTHLRQELGFREIGGLGAGAADHQSLIYRGELALLEEDIAEIAVPRCKVRRDRDGLPELGRGFVGL